MSDAVIYEVNLSVDEALRPSFEPWLESHIRELLALDGFLSATWSERESTSGRVEYTCAYWLRDWPALERYLAVDAPRMRGDGVARFAEGFSATRRIHRVRGRYEG